MKHPFSYRPGAMALGSVLALAACGGNDNPIGTGASVSPASGIAPASSGAPASSITAANAKEVAAQALFASEGLTGRASDSTTVVAGASSDAASKGLVDTSLNQMNKVLHIGFFSRAIGLNNTLTINCEQGGTATLRVDAASGKQFSTGDSVSLTADNCADGTNVANGNISAEFNNVTGTPSSTSAWSASTTLTFDNVTFDESDVSRFANGDVTLVYDQTAFRNATFSLTGDSVQLRRTTAASTDERTLTDLNTTGSVNGDTFTYRTNFTLAGNFPRLGQSSFDVTTTTDFVQQKGSDPSQGVLQVTGSDGSKLTLTAVAPSNVNVALDRDGDGVVDLNTTATWKELAALI